MFLAVFAYYAGGAVRRRNREGDNAGGAGIRRNREGTNAGGAGIRRNRGY